MDEDTLLVAIGCGRLPAILDTAARRPFVVFGTMDGQILASLIDHPAGGQASAVTVYFYETG